jgi:hypothetical protein
MTISKRRQVTVTEAEDCENRFSETGDPVFLALAIGRQPHSPPVWAVECCIALYEQVGHTFGSGGDKEKMGRRLDAMWRFFLAHPDEPERDDEGKRTRNKGPSIKAAARSAILLIDGITQSHQLFETGLRQLERAWDREQLNDLDPDQTYEVFDGLAPTHRFSRIFAEWGAGEYGGMTAHEASKAIFRSEAYRLRQNRSRN